MSRFLYFVLKGHNILFMLQLCGTGRGKKPKMEQSALYTILYTCIVQMFHKASSCIYNL